MSWPTDNWLSATHDALHRRSRMPGNCHCAAYAFSFRTRREENKKLCYRPQTGRATRSVSENLSNCRTTPYETTCTTNPEQIEVMESEGCSRPTCNKLCASSHGALDRRRCNPQERPSTSFVDHTIDLPWRNFLRPEFGAKFYRD